jgi:hypothetical protein
MVSDELTLTPNLLCTADDLSRLARASRGIKAAFAFLDEQLQTFDRICNDQACPRMDRRLKTHISEGFQQKMSLAETQLLQIDELRGRVGTQLKLVNILIAQRDSRINLDIASAARRDNQINIEIAAAMKMDSKMMRGIAAVTMVFLPATFMATFFSMVFFNVDPDTTRQLRVSPWIWLYAVLTVSWTVFILFGYWLMKRTSGPKRGI